MNMIMPIIPKTLPPVVPIIAEITLLPSQAASYY